MFYLPYMDVYFNLPPISKIIHIYTYKKSVFSGIYIYTYG